MRKIAILGRVLLAGTPWIALLGASAFASTPPEPAPAPSASASPPSDPCGDAHTNLLATLNRPTIGFSACAVRTHDTVAEIGYGNETINADTPSTSTTFPQGFMRYGLRKNLELDYIGPAFGVMSSGGVQQRGRLDSGVGAKIELFHDPSNVVGADILYTTPNGSPGFTNGGASITVNADVSHNLTPAFSMGATFGLTSTAGSRLDGTVGRYTALLPSIVATEQLGMRAQAYLEAYGATRIRPDGGSRFALDGGLQYLLSPQMEIDIEAGRTATDVSRSRFIGFGFGLRF